MAKRENRISLLRSDRVYEQCPARAQVLCDELPYLVSYSCGEMAGDHPVDPRPVVLKRLAYGDVRHRRVSGVRCLHASLVFQENEDSVAVVGQRRDELGRVGRRARTQDRAWGVGVVPSVEVLPGACSPRALKKIRASATGAVKDRLAESRQYKPRRPTIDPSREYSTSRHAVGWDSPLFTKSAHARAVVRAAQMYEWSRYLGQEAIAKTREIEINVEPGEHWTVGKVIDEYRLVVVTAMINDRRNVEQTQLWERMAENDRAFHGENWGEKFRINKKGEPDVYFEQIFETYCNRHRYGVLL